MDVLDGRTALGNPEIFRSVLNDDGPGLLGRVESTVIIRHHRITNLNNLL